MSKVLESVNNLVWGVPALVLIIGVGLYFSVRTGLFQLAYFPKALKAFLNRLRRKGNSSGKSSYRALCTALAATVGTGNIAGVAGAIAIGGPGAVFWMWAIALLGMITKFAEATLAVRFRSRDVDSQIHAGPMYMIRLGMHKRWHWLAGVYCFFGVVAAFGVGNATQINTVVGGINSIADTFGLYCETWSGNFLIGIILACLLLSMLLKGADRVGSIAERLVPFAALIYVALCVGAIIARSSYLPNAFRSIISGAFKPESVTGGMIGSFMIVLRTGASRGVFTNEAGMGTAAISHGVADVNHPVDQGLMGIVEVFLDTIVICTMTALVILCSGVAVPYGTDIGVTLTATAFERVYGSWIQIPLVSSLCLFAIATVVGWGLYGARCAQYLFGSNAWRPFIWVQGIVVILGSVLRTDAVWLFSEIVNGLMAIPNLIALICLSPELFRLINDYKIRCGSTFAVGGTYENFNQRKSLRTFSYEKVPSSGCESKESRSQNLSSEYRSA